MASFKPSLYAVLLLLAVDVIRGAPVQQSDNDSKGGDINNKESNIAKQEREIEDLLNLAKSEAKGKPVSVESHVQTHMENVNGHETQVQEKEEKVIDPSNNKVISDVKQTIQRAPSDGKGKPEVAIETNVDIPSAGVHETLNQQGAEQDATSGSDVSQVIDDAESAILDNDVESMRQDIRQHEQGELTPEDMAAFLYATQQLDAFYPALERLVNESKMTPDEAEAYAQEVVMQYQRLQLRDLEMNTLAEKRRAPPMDLYAQQPLTSGGFGVDSLAPQPVDAYGYNEAYLTPQDQFMIQLQLQQQEQLEQQQQQQFLPYNTENGFDPLDFLTVLYEAAYGKGNAEAQEILRLLYDRVSRDDNPNDLEQIRELLLETIASSLADDSPQPWDMPVLPPSNGITDFEPTSVDVMDPIRLSQDQLPNEEEDEDEEESRAQPSEQNDLEAELSKMNQKEKKDVEAANPSANDKDDDDEEEKDHDDDDDKNNKSA